MHQQVFARYQRPVLSLSVSRYGVRICQTHTAASDTVIGSTRGLSNEEWMVRTRTGYLSFSTAPTRTALSAVWFCYIQLCMIFSEFIINDAYNPSIESLKLTLGVIRPGYPERLEAVIRSRI